VKVKYIDGEIYIGKNIESHEKEFFDLISKSRISMDDWEDIQEKGINGILLLRKTVS